MLAKEIFSEGRKTWRRGGVLFVESTMSDREIYFQHFEVLVGKIKSLANGDIDWWVVGGIARDAWLGNNEPVVVSPEGSFRDVDLIFSDEKRWVGDEIKRANPTPIPTGSPFEWYLEINKDNIGLRFGKIRKKVPEKIFDTQILSLGGVDFPTLPAETLFHLYCLGERPDGKMREKDFLNALDLARYLSKHHNPDYSESLYRGFHEFSRARNQTRISLCQLLINAARMYRESPLNKAAPIANPKMTPLFRQIWSALGHA